MDRVAAFHMACCRHQPLFLFIRQGAATGLLPYICMYGYGVIEVTINISYHVCTGFSSMCLQIFVDFSRTNYTTKP